MEEFTLEIKNSSNLEDNRVQEIADQTTYIQQQQRPTRQSKKLNRLIEEC